ncbi:MAG: E3 ubiquitin protein ligase [Asgard group archaeon]|nr:E3 ubiquitin protein ligase [Asgard group archaeon]
MVKKRISIGIVLSLIIIPFSSFVIIGEIPNIPSHSEINFSSLINQDIVFEYDSSFTREEFVISSLVLELDIFNCLTLCFITDSSQSYINDLRVVFIINDTEIEFFIPRLYQDHSEHELVKTFFYPERFTGIINVTVICEGQTSNYPLEGSLTILSNTNIEPIIIPSIGKDSTSIPIVPTALEFLGSPSTIRTGSVESAFYISDDNSKLNLSLSFSTSFFSAGNKYIEILVNSTLIATKEFDRGILNSISFLLSPDIGLNVVSINFNVELCMDLVEIDNIQLFGYTYNLEELLPKNAIDYIHWEGSFSEQILDLSALKPSSTYSEHILRINVDYGYIGTTITPAIDCSLHLGSDVLISETITIDKQTNSSHSIEAETYTTSYLSPLIFRISGSAIGEGIFFIYDTSKVESETLPILQENSVRKLVEDETFTSNVDITVLEFYDVFRSTSSYVGQKLVFSFSLLNDLNEPVNQIDILLEISLLTVIDSSIFNKEFYNITESFTLLDTISEVRITLTIYNAQQDFRIQNFYYQLVSLGENSPPLDDLSSDILFDKPSLSTLWILLLIPFLVVISIGLKRVEKFGKMHLVPFLCNFVRESESKNDKSTPEEVEDNQIESTKKIHCFYCEAELEEIEDDGPIICLNCGKKTRTCKICMKYMVAGKELSQLFECGHVFHKDHILEWIRIKGICPICKTRINEESVITYYQGLLE